MASVYLITDNRGSFNEKDFYYYVGCTRQSIEKRFNNHIYGIKHDVKMKFYDEVRKHSDVKNLSVKLIEEVSDNQEERDNSETYYIKLFKKYYGDERVYNELDTARNYDNPEHFNKFMKAGHEALTQRTALISKMLSSNCMVLKYKEDGNPIIGKKDLWELLKSIDGTFTMTYDRFKIFCNTGKVSKKMWDRYGKHLQDIYYLDKSTETWRLALEPHEAEIYCQRDGTNNTDSTKSRNYFLGYIDLETKEYKKSEWHRKSKQ